jgi:hypothetical protein
MQIVHKALIYNNKEQLEAFLRLTNVHSCYFTVFYLFMFYFFTLSLHGLYNAELLKSISE